MQMGQVGDDWVGDNDTGLSGSDDHVCDLNNSIKKTRRAASWISGYEWAKKWE